MEPVKKLYATIVAPMAEKRTKGAWYLRWRLVSLDGSTLDAADTAENEKAFGRPGASRGSSAFPKIRFVALLESGTHILWAAQMDKYATDELTLAESVIPGAATRNVVPGGPVLPESDTPRRAGGLMGWAASKAVGPWV